MALSEVRADNLHFSVGYQNVKDLKMKNTESFSGKLTWQLEYIVHIILRPYTIRLASGNFK